MEAIFFIIIFVIIGIVSAASAAKKKPSGSSQDGQPPRRTMSDIQRAFMMMSGMENDDEQDQPGVTPPAPPRQPGYTPPAAPPQPRNVPPVQQRTAYTPPVATVQSRLTPTPTAATIQSRLSVTPPSAYGEGASDYGSSYGEGVSDYGKPYGEGVSDYGTARRGSITGDTAIEKEAGVKKYTAAAERIQETGESIDENELSILQESGGIYGEDLSEAAGAKRTKRHPLKLFADKDEYIRAIIYSEVFGSGPLKNRSAR